MDYPRGGYEVVRKKMRQWSIRISEYSERLLSGLDIIDWPDPLKEMQRNWIGKSKGAMIKFSVENSEEYIEGFLLVQTLSLVQLSLLLHQNTISFENNNFKL